MPSRTCTLLCTARCLGMISSLSKEITQGCNFSRSAHQPSQSLAHRPSTSDGRLNGWSQTLLNTWIVHRRVTGNGMETEMETCPPVAYFDGSWVNHGESYERVFYTIVRCCPNFRSIFFIFFYFQELNRSSVDLIVFRPTVSTVSWKWKRWKRSILNRFPATAPSQTKLTCKRPTPCPRSSGMELTWSWPKCRTCS